MKEYLIKDIETLSEKEAAELANEVMDIKGFNIYFIDFPGYFKYCCLVFKDGHHLYYADEHESTNSHIVEERGRNGLRETYIERLTKKLYTEEEIASPIKSYDEYTKKEYFLRNLYGQMRNGISAFCILQTKEQEEAFRQSITGKIYDPVCFKYFDPSERDFVEHHKELLSQLEGAKASPDNYEYWYDAFLYEMYNHEYAYALDGDYSTLTAFGHITPCNGNPLGMWFDELGFSDTQRRAYRNAARDCEQKMLA